MLNKGIHPNMVQESLGRANIQIALDTHNHVAPGLKEPATAGFDKMVLPRREKEAAKNDYWQIISKN